MHLAFLEEILQLDRAQMHKMNNATVEPAAVESQSSKAIWAISRRFAWPVTLVILSLCYYLLFFDRGVNFNDEGTLFMAADGILHGKTLYRDLYVAYMPGSYYLYALFFKLFGASVRMGRFLGVLLRCGNTLAVYYLAREMVTPGFAVLPAVALTLLPGPWHKTLFVTLSLLDMLLIARYAERHSISRLVLMGLATGLTLLYRYELGLVAIGAASIVLLLWVRSALRQEHKQVRNVLLREWVGQVGLYVIVLLLPVLVAIIYFYRQGALQYVVLFDALRGNLAKQGTMPMARNIFQPWVFRLGQLTRLLRYNALVVLYYFPVLVYACTTVVLLYRQLTRRGHVEDRALLTVLVFGVLVYGLVLLEPAIAHLLVSLPAAWVLGVYLVYRLGERLWLLVGHHSWTKAMACVLVLSPVVLWFCLLMGQVLQRVDVYMAGSIAQCFRNPAKLDLPRAQIFVGDEAEASALTNLASYIRARVPPGSFVLVVPAGGGTKRLLHFLTETFPPYRQRAILTGASAQELLQLQYDIVNSTDAARTEYAILSGSDQDIEKFPQGYLLHYVWSTFEVECVFGDYQVLRRKN